MRVRVQGRLVGTAEPVDLVAVDGLWSDDVPAAAEVTARGWVLPGLVDVHTHPGMERPGDPFSEQLLRQDLDEHVDAGVLAIRCPGLAGDPPGWFGTDPVLPWACHAGPWLARPGQFFDGMGRRVPDEDLAAVAAAQAAVTGWCKIIGDWELDDEPVPVDLLRDVVDAVHAVGGRVAVHAQQEQGSRHAVLAGVDSLEHGMHLDPALLPLMAAQGTALVPTLHVLTADLDQVRQRPRTPKRDWFLTGASRHGDLVVAAHRAGVLILAGTDSRPHGRVASEIQALARAGMPATDAIAAASWSARDYLGLGGLIPGATADATVYAGNPVDDLAGLGHPQWVIRAGAIVRPRP